MKEFNSGEKRKKKLSVDASKSKGIDARDKFAMQNVQKNIYITSKECTEVRRINLDEDVVNEVFYFDHDYLGM